MFTLWDKKNTILTVHGRHAPSLQHTTPSPRYDTGVCSDMSRNSKLGDSLACFNSLGYSIGNMWCACILLVLGSMLLIRASVVLCFMSL